MINVQRIILAVAVVNVVLKNGELTSLAFSSSSSSSSFLSVANDDAVASSSPSPATLKFHTVQGIRCREVTNDLPVIGAVVVLEATADAQEELVAECLELEEDEIDNEKSDDATSNSNKQKRKRIIAEGDPYGYVL